MQKGKIRQFVAEIIAASKQSKLGKAMIVLLAIATTSLVGFIVVTTINTSPPLHTAFLWGTMAPTFAVMALGMASKSKEKKNGK